MADLNEILARKRAEIEAVIGPNPWPTRSVAEIEAFCPCTASGRHVWRTLTVADAIARHSICVCCGAAKAGDDHA